MLALALTAAALVLLAVTVTSVFRVALVVSDPQFEKRGEPE